jgi:DNA-binding transcriptional ArsR family regulator
LLLDQARTAGEIVENFDMARPSVSGHVRALVACELVTEQGQGRSILDSIAPPAPLLEVGAWLSPFGRCWRNHLAGLRSVLDDIDGADGAAP